jgi:hypothetical protein
MPVLIPENGKLGHYRQSGSASLTYYPGVRSTGARTGGDARAYTLPGEMRVGHGLPSSWNRHFSPSCFGVARKAVVAFVGAQLPVELTQKPPVISPLSLMSPA